jgi:hypothetical protein
MSSGGGDGSMPSPDASAGGGTDAAGFACRNAVPSNQLGSGHHNPGQDCQQGCHNHGFTLSGTMFTSTTSSTPVIGATVTVVDANGQTFDMVTQLNGNFYTSNSVAFPVTVIASSCPSVQQMASTVPAGSGGCNKTGCHTTAAAGRIHLP